MCPASICGMDIQVECTCFLSTIPPQRTQCTYCAYERPMYLQMGCASCFAGCSRSVPVNAPCVAEWTSSTCYFNAILLMPALHQVWQRTSKGKINENTTSSDSKTESFGLLFLCHKRKANIIRRVKCWNVSCCVSQRRNCFHYNGPSASLLLLWVVFLPSFKSLCDGFPPSPEVRTGSCGSTNIPHQHSPFSL